MRIKALGAFIVISISLLGVLNSGVLGAGFVGLLLCIPNMIIEGTYVAFVSISLLVGYVPTKLCMWISA